MKMETMIKCFLAGVVGIALGYYWAFQAYQPIKLSQENQELKTDLKLLDMAYVREISKHFIDDSYEVIR